MFNKKYHNIILFVLIVIFTIAIPVSSFATDISEEIPVTEAENITDDSEDSTAEEEPAGPSFDLNAIMGDSEPEPSVADDFEIDTSSLDESKFDSATTVMLFDAVSGNVLYAKNPDKQIYPASTTKLMSVMIAIENGIANRDVTCTISADDYSADNSLMGIIRSETLPGMDLLYGMMLCSGNDAAANVAIDVGGSIEGFANLMNEKAAELGMTNSHFMNPSGVQDENHYTTGNDMKKIAMYAYKNDLFMQLCGTKTYTVEPTDLCKTQRDLRNTNRLLTTPVSEDPTVTYKDYTYEYATGMKTGYTYTANGCLVASAKKDDGQEFIVLIYNDTSESGANRWGMAKELFNFAFDNYARIKPSDYTDEYSVTEQVRNIAKNDPDNGKITFVADTRAFDESEITVTKSDAEAIQNGSLQITQQVTLSTILAAPLATGEKVGTVSYYLGDRCIGQAPLVTTRRVYAEGEEDYQTSSINNATAEELANTDVMQEIGQNKNVLWWLLIPIAVIVIIVLRAIYVAKRKSRLRRTGNIQERRISPGSQQIYRPNRAKQQQREAYRRRNRFQ